MWSVCNRMRKHCSLQLHRDSLPLEIDCSTPYDFETANAELEAELAKITINPDGIPTINTANEGNVTAGTTSTGDGVNTEPNSTTATRSPSSSTAAVCQTAANGNGASGDSSGGAVTSTVNASGMNLTPGDGAPTGLEANGPLAK